MADGQSDEWKLTPAQQQLVDEDEARKAQESGPSDDANARWYREQGQPATVATAPTPMRHALDIGAGYGLAYATNASGSAAGFTAELAHVWFVRPWWSPRIYAGTLVTGKGSCSGREPCDLTNQIFYVGGQAHIMAPIPYFGPFVDVGAGISLGTINAIVGDLDQHHSGVMPHLRLGAGIALGARNQYEIGLRVIDHFTAHSIAGGIMLGLRIPL